MGTQDSLGVPASPSRDPLQPAVSATPANAEEFHALILNHEDALTEGAYEGMNHHWTRIALVNAFEAARTDAYAEGRKDQLEELHIPIDEASPTQVVGSLRDLRICSLGVGCVEASTCYAAAHGQPDQCGLEHELPPLPEPLMHVPEERGTDADGLSKWHHTPLFTADQMQAYAREAIAKAAGDCS